MKNSIKTDFDLVIEELNRLDEKYDATADFDYNVNRCGLIEKKKAQDDFKDNAKKLILDYPNFHLGYDLMLYDALYHFYLGTNAQSNQAYADDHAKSMMNALFKDDGQWQNKGTYNYIKNVIVPIGNKELERALKTAWGLAYTSDSSKLATSVITMTGSMISASTNNANNAKQRAIDFVKKALDKTVVYSFAGSTYNDTISFKNASFEEKFLTFLCLQLSVEKEIETMPMAIRGKAITAEQRMIFISGLQRVRDIIYSKDNNQILDISPILGEVQSELEKGGTAYYTGWFEVFYNKKKIFVDFRTMEMGLALFMKNLGWHITYDELVDIIGINNIENHFKYGDHFLTLLYRLKVIED